MDKGTHQKVANFLVDHPAPKLSKLYEGILDETLKANVTSNDYVWQVFFDGASRIGPEEKVVVIAGMVLVSP